MVSARTSAGSSSTTSTVLTGRSARRQRQPHGQPAAGRRRRRQLGRPSPRRSRARRPGPAPGSPAPRSPSAPVARAEPENGANSAAQRPAATPGPWSTTSQPTCAGRGRAPRTVTGPVARRAAGRSRAGWPAPARPARRRRGRRAGPPGCPATTRSRLPRPSSARPTSSSSRTPLERRGHHAGLQPGGVEQVADQPLQPVGAVLDGRQQLRALGRRPGDVVLAQAAHRGLDRGQRRAQVVADAGEQRGPHPVGGLQLRGLGRPLRRAAGRAARPRRPRRSWPAPAGRRRTAPARGPAAARSAPAGTVSSASSSSGASSAADLDDAPAAVRRARAGRPRACRTPSRTRTSTSVQRPVLGERGAGQAGERLRLRPRARRLGGAGGPRGRPTELTATATTQEDREDDDLLGRVDHSVPNGGVKNQLSSSTPATAPGRATRRPPSSALPTTSTRTSSTGTA